MSDDLNSEVASSATTSENSELIIPSIESLEPTQSDKIDQQPVDAVINETCAITADIDEPIGSKEETNSLVMTVEPNISNEYLEISVGEKHNNEKLLDIGSEHKLDQIDTDANGCMYKPCHDKLARSVPNVENKTIESISEIEINVDQVDQIVDKNIGGN